MFAKLIMVTAMNNNKFYVMQSNDDNTSFTATYGRVGNAGQTATYPMSKWSQKYNEKIKKGYKVLLQNSSRFLIRASRKRLAFFRMYPGRF